MKAARKTAPVYKVGAGSTLKLGDESAIRNVISKNPMIEATGTATLSANVILDGATITGNAAKNGSIVYVTLAGNVTIEDGTLISNNVSYDSSTNGMFYIYAGASSSNRNAKSTMTMNGGEIVNNYFGNSGMIGLNGTKTPTADNSSTFTMNGGRIAGNKYMTKENCAIDGFAGTPMDYCTIKLMNNSHFTMNGGEIVDNETECGVVHMQNENSNVIFNKGTVRNNKSPIDNTEYFGYRGTGSYTTTEYNLADTFTNYNKDAKFAWASYKDIETVEQYLASAVNK